MTLSELLDASLIGRADVVALEFEDGAYTFGELDARANRLANAFQARGLKDGDRVVVYLANSVEMIDIYLASVKLGLIFVPVNILYREREIQHILTDAEPALSIGVPTGLATSDLISESSSFPATSPPVALNDDMPAGIIYTSGTTGRSKGAVLTRRNFAVNAEAIVDAWRISSADRFLLTLPLFHVHGLGNGLHGWLASGCRMRLLRRFEHQTIAREFATFRPTLFFGVPAMYVRLLDLPAEQTREIGAAMRLFVSGSAALSPQVFDDFRAKFGHAILERYGMSETLMIMGNPYDGERRPGTVGRPFPHVSVRLLDPEGNPAPDAQPGEIYIQGPNVFAGYWRQEEATRAAFRDGYFRTGDVAVRSPDGYHTLCGRKSDVIISAGFNVYPREIEELLEDQDGVAEAAVVGSPDRVRGEVPIAYIVAAQPIDPAALESCCRQKLASFKIPRAFIQVEALPRNALGKVQKHLLERDPGNRFEIQAYEDRPAIYAPYDQRAPEIARLLAEAIEREDSRLKVDHIGSTSVPGCSGKGIIDLAVTFAPGELEHAKDALAKLGFQHQTGREPFPESRPMRVAAVSGLGGDFRVHAHVIEREGAEHRELVGFRDALRCDSALRAAYEQQKAGIVGSGVTDSLDYCNLKSEFVVAALARLGRPLRSPKNLP